MRPALSAGWKVPVLGGVALMVLEDRDSEDVAGVVWMKRGIALLSDGASSRMVRRQFHR
jgi:hypothetical protein